MTPAADQPLHASSAASHDHDSDRLIPLADGHIAPAASEFADMSRSRRVLPVTRRLLADGFTPVGLYQTLADERAGTFLLESAENGRSWSRYSFVGVRCRAMLTEVAGEARWVGSLPVAEPTGTDPLGQLRDIVAALDSERVPGLPPFTSGMVGAIGYDAVRRWERLPDTNPDELHFPEIAMLLASDLAVLDHTDGTVLLIANTFNDPDASDAQLNRNYADACERIAAMSADLAQGVRHGATTFDVVAAPPAASRSGREKYLADVETSREYIRAGDAFQIVLSQRFEAPCPATALDVYRVLRATNPSPYMYLIRLPEPHPDGSALSSHVAFDVVGSSPEALVTVQDRRCMLHPIAGTRPRSADPEQDQQLAEDLLADSKERSEHLMLVDLGRNDLGRVCQPGTVDVVEFMQVERYSHVMHLVSTVVGSLADGKTAYDALAATFPAGTLSGAPKPRAMEIIEELEPARRGLYAGAVGYLDFSGDLDTAIAIRTAVIADGTAHVQAGAGLVADSVAELEEEESRNKAAAVLNAIASAATMVKT